MVSIFRSLGVILVASIWCVLISWFLYQSFGFLFEITLNTIFRLILLGIVISLGMGLYFLTAAVFRFEEFKLIREQLL